jgi:hypothetical protein
VLQEAKRRNRMGKRRGFLGTCSPHNLFFSSDLENLLFFQLPLLVQAAVDDCPSVRLSCAKCICNVTKVLPSDRKSEMVSIFGELARDDVRAVKTCTVEKIGYLNTCKTIFFEISGKPPPSFYGDSL